MCCLEKGLSNHRKCCDGQVCLSVCVFCLLEMIKKGEIFLSLSTLPKSFRRYRYITINNSSTSLGEGR